MNRIRTRRITGATLLATALAVAAALPATTVVHAGVVCSVRNLRTDAVSASLASAIAGAATAPTLSTADTLKVQGTCFGTATIDRNVKLLGATAAEVAGGASLPVLDVNQASRVLRVNAGVAVRITGILVTDGNAANAGYAVGKGGGILNEGRLILDGAQVAGNTATSGGGIYNDGGQVTMLGASRVMENEANGGGGIYSDGGTVRIGGTAQIHTNIAGAIGGAAMVIRDSIVTLRRSARIHHNTSESTGGAIDIDPVASVARLTMGGNARIDHNVADDGAAIWGEGAIILRDQARIDRNSVSGDLASGSTVYLFAIGPDGATVTLSDEARIRDNTAGPTGAAVYFLMTCGPVDPTISGAAGRVIGNAPRNVKRSNDPCL